MPETRPLNWPALIETCLLAAIAAILLTRLGRGVMAFYIHPRYNLLVAACALVLLLVAGARLRALFTPAPEPFAGRQLGYALLCIPVLFAILVPARPLGADALAIRSTGIPFTPASSSLLPADTSTWNLLDWATGLSIQQDQLEDAPVRVQGFVYQQTGLGPDSFVVARYVLTCCAADGAPVGLPVRWAQGGSLPPDSWVEVEGVLHHETVAGSRQPVIVASRVAPLIRPSNPYLYR